MSNATSSAATTVGERTKTATGGWTKQGSEKVGAPFIREFGEVNPPILPKIGGNPSEFSSPIGPMATLPTPSRLAKIAFRRLMC
jgi:hypothetical protein